MLIYMEVDDKKNTKFKFGLKKSKLTDHEKVCMFQYEKVDLPTKFSLNDTHIIHIFNQGNLNSCSANAISNQFMLSASKEELQDIIPSRLYLYFNSRLIDEKEKGGHVHIEDEGATFVHAYEAFTKYNWVDENEYKYNESNVNKFPPPDVYRKAYKSKPKIHSYRRVIPQLYSIKYILAVLKRPIAFGMSVYENFVDLDRNNFVLSEPRGQYLGLHAVLAIGYDDNDKTIDVVNSHGLSFGNNGRFKMSYSYALNPDLCFEWWLMNEE